MSIRMILNAYQIFMQIITKVMQQKNCSAKYL